MRTIDCANSWHSMMIMVMIMMIMAKQHLDHDDHGLESGDDDWPLLFHSESTRMVVAPAPEEDIFADHVYPGRLRQ